jgi:hypothetical protein
MTTTLVGGFKHVFYHFIDGMSFFPLTLTYLSYFSRWFLHHQPVFVSFPGNGMSADLTLVPRASGLQISRRSDV